MLNIILLGPPGAGKGTQALKMKEKYNLLHISTGDIFRNEIKDETDIGLKAKAFIDKGMLVPDDIVINILENAAAKVLPGQGLLFDGFPRTHIQAVALDNMLRNKGIPVSLVIFLDTCKEELLKRLLIRARVMDRSDDTPDVIKHRLEVFKNQTEPLLDYYIKQKKLQQVEGQGSIESVFYDVCKVIDPIL